MFYVAVFSPGWRFAYPRAKLSNAFGVIQSVGKRKGEEGKRGKGEVEISVTALQLNQRRCRSPIFQHIMGERSVGR